MRTRSILALTLLLLTLLLVPGGRAVAAKPAGGTDPARTPSRDLVLDWRRDVWQDPELRTLSATGTDLTTIHTGLVRSARPRWSPDGSAIAGYLRLQGGTDAGDRALMISRPDGTLERTLLDAGTFAPVSGGVPAGNQLFGNGTWCAPRTFVFSGLTSYGPREDGRQQLVWRLYAVDVTTAGSRVPGSLRRLTDDPGGHHDRDPDCRADGTVVFVRDPEYVECEDGCTVHPWYLQQRELWTVREGGTAQQLTDLAHARPDGDRPDLSSPAWNPAGTAIVVTGDQAAGTRNHGDLWLVRLTDGTTVTALRALPDATEREATWAPDGRSIVFVEVTVANSRTNRYRLVTHRIDDGAERILIEQTKQAFCTPHFNPAGASPA